MRRDTGMALMERARLPGEADAMGRYTGLDLVVHRRSIPEGNTLRRDAGFTLLELMIAASCGLIVVAAAFAVLTSTQRVVGKQAAADDLVASARIAMEVMARDIRSAGDSMGLLSAPCLDSAGFLPTDHLCPAILDPHPWRIAVARNAWIDANADGSTFSKEDEMPPPTRAFADGPDNVVVYQFVPEAGYETPKAIKGSGGDRVGSIGRLERVANPFGFGGEAPRVTVLLDRILLDDRMKSDPSDPTASDGRFSHSLFMYRLLTRSGDLQGDAGLVSRASTYNGLFLSPPLRFFQVGNPPDYNAVRPWMPAYNQQIVGLKADGSPVNGLFSSGALNFQAAPADPTTSALRLILDRNRIRAVRVAFKVVDSRERPGVVEGIDLDGDPANGLAQVYMFETMVELKPLAFHYAGL